MRRSSDSSQFWKDANLAKDPSLTEANHVEIMTSAF